MSDPRNCIALTLLVAAFTGCGDRDPSAGTAAPPSSAASVGTASVRVLHASSDAPPVDVLVDDQVVLTGVPYKTGSGYLQVPAGERSFKVNVAGTTTTAIDVTPDLVADQSYTVIALNRVASIEPLLLVDDVTAPTAGNVRLRVVHGSPNAGPVDVYLTAPNADLSITTPTLAGVELKDASGFLEIPEGSYQARVTSSGTQNVVYDSGPLTLDAASVLTLVAVDSTGLSPISLIALTGQDSNPAFEIPNRIARIRAVHASPDAPDVDVLVDGAVALQAVAYKQFSGYLQLNSGPRRIQVNPANTTTSVIDATLDLKAGQDHTVIAADLVASISPLVLEDDNSAPAPGSFKLRLVHASPSAGQVDIYITAPGADLALSAPTVTGFTFRQVTPYVEAPTGDYQVRVTLAGTTSVAIDTGPLTLSDGQVRTAIAVDPAPLETSFGALLLRDRN